MVLRDLFPLKVVVESMREQCFRILDAIPFSLLIRASGFLQSNTNSPRLATQHTLATQTFRNCVQLFQPHFSTSGMCLGPTR
jgi:hypothetical protein